MSIYDLNNMKLVDQLKKFQKTNYGKIAFCLAYAPFIIELLFSILLGILLYYWYPLIILLPIFLILTIYVFITGSRYYYQELKGFIDHQKSK